MVFYANGAGVNGTMDEQSFIYDEESKELEANSFTRTGYTFEGWATSPSGAKEYDDMASVRNLTPEKDGRLELYAVWKANTYIVRFNKNGEDATGTMNDQNFSYDEAQTLRANNFSRAGYSFGGWSDSPEGEAVFMNSQSVKNLATQDGAVVNLYAKWIPGDGIEYTVKHWKQNVDDDGYTLASTQNLTGTTGAQTQAAAESYPGFTAKPFSQDTIAGDGTTVVDVYYDRYIHSAIWEVDGGTPISSVPYRYEQVIIAPDQPSKEGYNFTGWTWEGNSTPKLIIPESVKMGTANMTFTANWSPITYTVSFNTADGSSVSDQTIGYKGKVARPADPTKEGHTFEGWYTDETLETPYDFDQEVTQSFTLYAKWKINIYTLTFESNGGTEVPEQKINHGSRAEAPSPAPEKEGYTFGGWYIDAACNSAYDFNNSVTGGFTLYAKWDILRFTVTFNPKGGSSVDSLLVDYNHMAADPSAPARTGYIFDGWYIDEDCYTVYNFNTPVTSNLTLYAGWSPISYSVVFDKNSEAAEGTMDAQSFVYGESKALIANSFGRTGYTFDGWNTKANGTGTDYDDEDYVSNLSTQNGAAVTLYAKWKNNAYTVCFNGNGSTSGSMADQTFAYDIAQNLRANGFKKTGHSFSGWNTEPDGSGSKTYGNMEEVLNLLTENGDSMTLYAQWSINQYTITFKYDSNTEYRTITRNYGAEVTAPENPERNGYAFIGWTSEIPETMPAQNLVLTAKWTAITYNINYDLDGGVFNVEYPTSYTIEQSLALVQPIKAGYVFTGWTGTGLTEKTMDVIIEAGSYGDRYYTASWKKEDHIIRVVGKNGINYFLRGQIGDTITLPSTLEGETEDATVLAWFPNSSYSTEITTYTVQGIENETIYAWAYSSSYPCLIQSYNELSLLSSKVNANSNGGRWRYGSYKLGYQDSTPVKITIKNVLWSAIGSSNYPFEGIFDGNSGNCEIQFNEENNVRDQMALFSYIGINGTVKNVRVTGWLKPYSYTYGTIASINNGTIEDCIFSGTISGLARPSSGTGSAGGIVGENYGTILRCTLGENTFIDAISTISGTAKGADYVGGIAGRNYGYIMGDDTIITGITIHNGGNYVGGIVGENSGEVSGWTIMNSYIRTIDPLEYKNQYCNYVGGIAGYNKQGAALTDCTFENSSVGDDNTVFEGYFVSKYVGGMAGYNEGSISGCTVSGKKVGCSYTVYGEGMIGGIAGLNTGSISDCDVYDARIYSHKDISGGIVGLLNKGSISNCSVEGNTEIRWTKYIGGIVGFANTSVNYTVSDCTVGNTVTLLVKPENIDFAGQLVGNLVEHESTDWLTNCSSEAVVDIHPKPVI